MSNVLVQFESPNSTCTIQCIVVVVEIFIAFFILIRSGINKGNRYNISFNLFVQFEVDITACLRHELKKVSVRYGCQHQRIIRSVGSENQFRKVCRIAERVRVL